MKVYVPGRSVNFPLTATGWPGKGLVTLDDGVQAYVGLALQPSSMKIKPYFYDTEQRKINNCVHSKLQWYHSGTTDSIYRRHTILNGYGEDGNFYAMNGRYWSPSGRFLNYWYNDVVRVLRGDEPQSYGIIMRYGVSRATGNAITGWRVSLSIVEASVYIGRDFEEKRKRYTFLSASVVANCSATGVTVNTRTGVATELWDKREWLHPSFDDIVIYGGSRAEAEQKAAYMFEARARSLVRLLADLIVIAMDPSAGGTVSTPSVVGVIDHPSIPTFDRTNFLLDEPALIQERWPHTSNPLTGYWRQWLIQHAYYDALTQIPAVSDNSIQNIVEIIGFAKALIVDHRIEIPRSLQDAWLSYRYSYSTTRLDVEEAIRFVNRSIDLGDWRKGLTCYGISETLIDGVPVTCRCQFDIKCVELGILDDLWSRLTEYGLAPDLYVLWDSLPYSFVVDWFIPIGDMASVIDAKNAYLGDSVKISNTCFSLKYTTTRDHYDYVQYSRWAQKPLRDLNALLWLDKPAASGRVCTFRFLDAITLFRR